jgi:hypothetical protein
MRNADPAKARAVDEAIKHIPESSMPIRIDVPGAPPERMYSAVIPDRGDAPVVIYRRIQPADEVHGDWLVTTLIDRKEYEEYLRAEMRGILDNPAVRDIARRLAGTIATIVNVEQSGSQQGGPVPTGFAAPPRSASDIPHSRS